MDAHCICDGVFGNTPKVLSIRQMKEYIATM